MRRVGVIAVLAWILSTPASARADPPSRFAFRSYGTEAGLSNLSITAITQTGDGILWVGTEDGLFGFDGAHFHRIDVGDGLPSSGVLALVPDANAVWAGTTHGLARVDRDHVDRAAATGVPEIQINALATAADGHIWVATDVGLFVGRAGHFDAVAGWPGGASNAVWVDADGQVSAGRAGDLVVRDPTGAWTTPALHHEHADPDTLALGDVRIDQIARTPDGMLWVRSTRYLWECRGAGVDCRDASSQLPDSGETGRLLVDHAGLLWVATRHGFAHRLAEGTWELLGTTEGVPARSVLLAFQDREGSLWIVADQLYQQLGLGLWRAHSADSGFPGDTVWGIARDADGQLVAATDRGVLEGVWSTWEQFPGTESYSIAALADAGSIWFAAGLESRVLMLDRAKRTTTVIGRVEGAGVLAMTMEGTTLWIATWNAGLWRVTDAATPQRAWHREDIPGGEPREIFNQILIDRAGRLWATGTDGVAVRDGATWRRYTERDGLVSHETAYIVARASGEMCIAYVEAHGITCFHRATDGTLVDIRQMSVATGLTSDKIYVLGEDPGGRMYAGLGVGVDVIAGTHVEHFSTATGLVGDDCVARAFRSDPDGTVLIGTTRGIARFDSAHFAGPQPPSAPVLISVKLDDQRVPVSDQPIVSPHVGATSLAIHFETPTFTDRTRLEHEVRLVPLEPDWRTASVDEARYAQLAPGTYRFEVRARVGPGEFGPITSIELTVLPAWWQTAWVRVAAGALGMLVLAGLIAWRMRVSSARARVTIVARSEASFRALIEQSPDAVIVHRSGTVVYANPRAAAMLGHELVGTQILDVVDPADREQVIARAEALLASGEPVPAREIRMRAASGAALVLDVSELRVDFDGAQAILAIGRDITERKALEARLMFTDRMASIGTLAAGIAHEINNPLAYLQANLALIQDATGAALSRELREALADASEGAQRIQHIVRGVKAFSRIDDETRTAIDVHVALDSALKMTVNELRHRCTIVKDLGPVPFVLANESRLGQVFINLLVNAAQAMPERSVEANRIVVSTYLADDGGAVIEIADTGSGMTPEVASRVFEPFFTTKDIGQGTGLGLSVCHGIVTAFGGQITVDSAVGVGTTFRIALPAAAAGAPVAPIAHARTLTPRPIRDAAAKLRVLVIDDDTRLLESIGRMLRGRYDTSLVSDPANAIAELRAGASYDAILCDLMMPGYTGMQLYVDIARARPELAGRMLFMTGGAFTIEAQQFLAQPGIRTIEKPFPLAEIRRQLAEVAAE